MSTPIVRKVAIRAPSDFVLHGSPVQVGSQLAEHVLRGPLRAVLDAAPADAQEPILAGLLSELQATACMKLGKARASSLFAYLADQINRMPADLSSKLPSDPEVH